MAIETKKKEDREREERIYFTLSIDLLCDIKQYCRKGIHFQRNRFNH